MLGVVAVNLYNTLYYASAAALRSVGELELDGHTVLKLNCLHNVDEVVDIIATDKLGNLVHGSNSTSPAPCRRP